ncbi:hypothetical protein [Candidatus Mesenet endosymbiont of Agriotes lineatus]
MCKILKSLDNDPEVNSSNVVQRIAEGFKKQKAELYSKIDESDYFS